MKISALAVLAAGLLGASSASAGQLFSSTFESAPFGYGSWGNVSGIDGWTGGPNQIEVQNHAAGSPAAGGGDKFVELDTFANSSMSRTIGAGTFDLSFLYSPRPGVAAASNVIEVFLNQTLLGAYTGDGQGDTVWTTENLHFTTGGGLLTFAAAGVSDSLGGYVDNITLSTGVPEPAIWGLMLVGFGLTGLTLRRRPALAVA
jgi:hypothetical protein